MFGVENVYKLHSRDVGIPLILGLMLFMAINNQIPARLEQEFGKCSLGASAGINWLHQCRYFERSRWGRVKVEDLFRSKIALQSKDSRRIYQIINNCSMQNTFG